MPPHPLTNIELRKHHQNRPKFDGAFYNIIYLK